MTGHTRRGLLRAVGGTLGGGLLAGCGALPGGSDDSNGADGDRPGYATWLPGPKAFFETAPEGWLERLDELSPSEVMRRMEYGFGRLGVETLLEHDDSFDAPVTERVRSVLTLFRYPLLDTPSVLESVVMVGRIAGGLSLAGPVVVIYTGTFDRAARVKHLRNVRFEPVGEHRGYRVLRKVAHDGRTFTVGAGSDGVAVAVTGVRDPLRRDDRGAETALGRQLLEATLDSRTGEASQTATDVADLDTLVTRLQGGLTVSGQVGQADPSPPLDPNAGEIRAGGVGFGLGDPPSSATVSGVLLPGEDADRAEIGQWRGRDGELPTTLADARVSIGDPTVVSGSLPTKHLRVTRSATVTFDVPHPASFDVDPTEDDRAVIRYQGSETFDQENTEELVLRYRAADGSVRTEQWPLPVAPEEDELQGPTRTTDRAVGDGLVRVIWESPDGDLRLALAEQVPA